MAKKWVVNSSPIILLAKASRLDLLLNAGAELVIPSGVSEEISAHGDASDPAKEWLSIEGKRFVKVVDVVEPAVISWDLGKGESHVLSWALTHRGWEAILDDRAARRCAAAFGLPVRGTLGVILLAKKEGRISRVEPLLDRLHEIGYRIHPELHRYALGMAGEI